MGLKESISQALSILAIIQVVLSSPCDPSTENNLNSFEAQLYPKLVDANSDKNIFYSPLSLKMCLAMIRQGASGETGEQIDAALNASGQGPPKLADNFHNILQKYRNNKILKIASRIYVKSGYKAQRSFHASLRQKFFSSMASINFNQNKAAANAINHWVENQSGITDLISPDQLDHNTRLVLVNALKFKGKWASRFDPSDTYDALFASEDGTKFNVKMMFQSGKFRTGYVDEMKADVLEMPYKDSNFSMIIVLPSGQEPLADVEKKVNTIPWTDIETELGVEQIDVHIPKFKLEFKTELSDLLSQMGVQRIFSPDAQFDKMLSAGGQAVKGLMVNKIVHKAFIEVDEEGATAGAATGVGFTYRFMSTKFIADRPFYFFIKDEMNNKIFEGRINKKFSS